MYNFNKIYIQVSEIQKSEQHRFESQAASIKSNCSSQLSDENTAYDEILLTAVLNSNIYHTFKFPQIPVCFAESTILTKNVNSASLHAQLAEVQLSCNGFTASQSPH